MTKISVILPSRERPKEMAECYTALLTLAK
jgi:hypothetical protein